MAGVEIDNDMHKDILNKSIKISAWVQIGFPLLLGFGVLVWFVRRRKVKK